MFWKAKRRHVLRVRWNSPSSDGGTHWKQRTELRVTKCKSFLWVGRRPKRSSKKHGVSLSLSLLSVFGRFHKRHRIVRRERERERDSNEENARPPPSSGFGRRVDGPSEGTRIAQAARAAPHAVRDVARRRPSRGRAYARSLKLGERMRIPFVSSRESSRLVPRERERERATLVAGYEQQDAHEFLMVLGSV